MLGLYQEEDWEEFGLRADLGRGGWVGMGTDHVGPSTSPSPHRATRSNKDVHAWVLNMLLGLVIEPLLVLAL